MTNIPIFLVFHNKHKPGLLSNKYSLNLQQKRQGLFLLSKVALASEAGPCHSHHRSPDVSNAELIVNPTYRQ